MDAKIVKIELIVAAEAISADGTIELFIDEFVEANSGTLHNCGLAILDADATLIAEVTWTNESQEVRA